MNDTPYTPPSLDENAFNCPHCGAFAHQEWTVLYTHSRSTFREIARELKAAYCSQCRDYSVWYSDEMIRPTVTPVERPNADLPEDVKKDYEEAAQIVQKSPRAAGALLRLAIQRLCIHLGGAGNNLNSDIATLVKGGLPTKVQQILDTVRVIGNHAVHPGQIDLEDQPQTVTALFRLVNIIAEKMITEQKDIDAIYNDLPTKDLEGIAKRDAQKQP